MRLTPSGTDERVRGQNVYRRQPKGLRWYHELPAEAGGIVCYNGYSAN